MEFGNRDGLESVVLVENGCPPKLIQVKLLCIGCLKHENKYFCLNSVYNQDGFIKRRSSARYRAWPALGLFVEPEI